MSENMMSHHIKKTTPRWQVLLEEKNSNKKRALGSKVEGKIVVSCYTKWENHCNKIK